MKEKLQGEAQCISGLPREINVVFYWGMPEGAAWQKIIQILIQTGFAPFSFCHYFCLLSPQKYRQNVHVVSFHRFYHPAVLRDRPSGALNDFLTFSVMNISQGGSCAKKLFLFPTFLI